MNSGSHWINVCISLGFMVSKSIIFGVMYFVVSDIACLL